MSTPVTFAVENRPNLLVEAMVRLHAWLSQHGIRRGKVHVLVTFESQDDFEHARAAALQESVRFMGANAYNPTQHPRGFVGTLAGIDLEFATSWKSPRDTPIHGGWL